MPSGVHEPYAAQAFSAGCDARLRGEPLEPCPYDDHPGRTFFRSGWLDIDRFWGSRVNGRWPYRKAPLVLTAERQSA